jgi:hypothetical protein
MSLNLEFVKTMIPPRLRILELLVIVNTTPLLGTGYNSYRDSPLRPYHVVSHAHSDLGHQHLLELTIGI